MPLPRNLSGAKTCCKRGGALPWTGKLGRRTANAVNVKKARASGRAFSCALMHYYPSKSSLRALLSAHSVEGARDLLLDRLSRIGGNLGA